MSLLLLFRARSNVSGDQTVTHTSGILSLVGGTHTPVGEAAVTATPGILALKGGTHTTSLDSAITHTAGILVLVGGTHTPDNGVENPLRNLPQTGVGL